MRLRWPLEPVLELTGHPPALVLAARVGVSARTVHRWRHNGLTDQQADHAAIALGRHPATIWPDWHAAVLR